MSMKTYQGLAEQLYQALFQEEVKDERNKKVREIINQTDLQGRANIRAFYDKLYAEKNLMEDLDSQLSSDFRDLVMQMFMTPLQLDCDEINKALNSFTYSKDNLFEFLTSRPYRYLQKVKEKYKEIYGKDLEKEIKDKFNSNMSENILTLLNKERGKDLNPKDAKVKEKAQLLVNVKPGDWIENKKIFNEVFAQSSPEELVLIGREYFLNSGKDLTEETKHPLLKEIIFNSTIPAENFARKLHQAIKGFYTESKIVNRIMASRGEVDLDTIKDYYLYIYHIALAEDIQNETSGAYRDLLLDITNKEVNKRNMRFEGSSVMASSVKGRETASIGQSRQSGGSYLSRSQQSRSSPRDASSVRSSQY